MGTVAQAQPLCLHPDQVEGWKIPDDATLIVTERAGRKFKLSLTGDCHDLQFRTVLSFQSQTHQACLARNDRVDATMPGYKPQICRIAGIEDYTATMENADEMAEASLYHHPDTKASIGAIP